MEPAALHPDPAGARYISPALTEHILSQIQRELDAEVTAQNRQAHSQASSATPGWTFNMRELSNMASTMREAMAALKQKIAASTQSFETEVGHSHINVDKVDAVTSELKAANKEVEQMLGESGSNFTPAGSEQGLGPPDINGVQINRVK